MHASQFKANCHLNQDRHSSHRVHQSSPCSTPLQPPPWVPAWLHVYLGATALPSGTPRRSHARQQPLRPALQTLQPACSCSTSSPQAPWRLHPASPISLKSRPRRWRLVTTPIALSLRPPLLRGSQQGRTLHPTHARLQRVLPCGIPAQTLVHPADAGVMIAMSAGVSSTTLPLDSACTKEEWMP